MRCTSSMKSTSRSWRFVSIAARSPAFSITGPAVDRIAHAELVGDDVGERRLAEPGRAVEQHVIERLAALLGRGDRHLQVLAHAILPDVVVERARPQPGLVLASSSARAARDEAVVGHAPFIIDRSASRSACSKPASGDALSTLSMAFSAAGALIAEIDQRRQQIVAQLILRPAAPPAPGRPPGAAVRQPVLQLEADPLGGLLADARESSSAARRPACGSRGSRSAGSMPDSTASAELRTDAADRDQPLEEILLERRAEPVERDAHPRARACGSAAPPSRRARRARRTSRAAPARRSRRRRRRRRRGSGASRAACRARSAITAGSRASERSVGDAGRGAGIARGCSATIAAGRRVQVADARRPARRRRRAASAAASRPSSSLTMCCTWCFSARP